jgi:hypothetical protein
LYSWCLHHVLLEVLFFRDLHGLRPFSIIFDHLNKYVFLKLSFHDLAILQYNGAKSVLHSLFPVAFVAAAVNPVHLTVAMPFIVPVLSNIVIATLPIKLTVAMLSIIAVVA